GDTPRKTVEIQLRTERELLEAYADDMKGGGLRSYVPEPLDVESEVELELFVLGSSRPTRLLARVCWNGRDGMTGFQFLEPAIGLQQRIEEIGYAQIGTIEAV
ncbi:MAG: PilZ domain-containing protein, partial [Myxococcota bacterium]